MKRGVHHPLIALDIENDPKTGAFICAGLFGKIGSFISRRMGNKVIKLKREIEIKEYFSSQADLHEYLLELKKGSCKIVFYNLSYDIVFLRDIVAPPSIDKKGNIKASMLQVGTRVICATLKNGIRCLDLFNHTCEGSLEDWSKYCDFRSKFGIEKTDLNDLHRRVMIDAELTFRLGEFIEDFYFNECEIPLQLTVGASALKLFTTKYFTDFWSRDDEDASRFERQAYFGGRTEIFRRGDLFSYSYDINSTYLSIMRDCKIPDINSIRFRNNDKTVKLDLGKDLKKHLSIIECTVKTPDDIYIGVLPARVKNKLTFPRGTFRGTWTNIELIEAINAGYKIIAIHRYIFYRQAKKYFAEYARFVWKKRIEYRKKGNAGMDKMIKRVGNSLYGKFGERHKTQIEHKLSEIDFEIPEGSEIFNYLGEAWVRINGDITPSEHEFPCIPAFITAYARIKLYHGMKANENELIYTDTDSIKLLKPARGITIGEKLGQWKNEGSSQTVFYRAKFYGSKHKGVPKSCEYLKNGVCYGEREKCNNPHVYDAVKENKISCNRSEIAEKNDKSIKYRFIKPIREREAMRHDIIPNVWTVHYKTLLFNDDKRIWRGNESIPDILTE